ncbi:AraC family transcriptional regulator [Bradyrhizobium liaoningense]
MRDDMHAVPPKHGHHPALCDKRHPRGYPLEERAWRRPEQNDASLAQDITISRWLDLRTASRTEEAVTPNDRYFIGVALRTTRIKLTGEQRTIFEGVMPESTLYVSAPSKRLAARFDAPCDFLHFHVPDSYFTDRLPIAQRRPTQHLNDLILLRDMFAGQLTRPLLGPGEPIDDTFARCIGQTLAMRLARLEFPRTKVGALANWRLRRVQDHVKQNFRRSIRLPERGSGCRTFPYAFCRAVPGRDGIPPPRISAGSTGRTREDAAEYRGASRPNRARGRILHSGTFLGGVQRNHR